MLHAVLAYMIVVWRWIDKNLLSIDADMESLALLSPTSAQVLEWRRSKYAENGYHTIRQASNRKSLAPLIAEVDAARGELAKGGYRIWAPAEELPPALRAWSENEGVELMQRVLPAGAKLKCIGGAALIKLPNTPGNAGTPFHQDDAYQDESHRLGKRAGALWLALSSASTKSGCLRFAPTLGFALLPHETAPRDTAPSGFENFLTHGSHGAAAAEREAVSESVDAGDAIVISGKVVHGSHPALNRERLAFSPLYEWA